MGFYVHVPFCAHLCPYCDFTKTTLGDRTSEEAFWKSLYLQCDDFLLQLTQKSIVKFTHATLYFGGGTPSLFGAEYLRPIIDKIRKHYQLLEVTLETNPLLKRKEESFVGWRAAGIDRITLGAQSLCPQVLKKLGRKHTPSMIFESLQLAREAGFQNLQTDLIYGINRESTSLSFRETIQQLVKAGATGISTYLLTLEKNSAFFKERVGLEGEEEVVHPMMANEDECQTQYLEILETCQAQGLEQIEVGNYAKPSHLPLHNLLYWRGFPYLGLGTGAHGLFPPTSKRPWGQRYAIGAESSGEFPLIAPGHNRLDFATEGENARLFQPKWAATERNFEEWFDEILYTQLRTCFGLSIDWLEELFGQKVEEIFAANSKIMSAIAAGAIMIEKIPLKDLSENHSYRGSRLRISPRENIRGDFWILEIICTLSECLSTKGLSTEMAKSWKNLGRDA